MLKGCPLKQEQAEAPASRLLGPKQVKEPRRSPRAAHSNARKLRNQINHQGRRCRMQARCGTLGTPRAAYLSSSKLRTLRNSQAQPTQGPRGTLKSEWLGFKQAQPPKPENGRIPEKHALSTGASREAPVDKCARHRGA